MIELIENDIKHNYLSTISSNTFFGIINLKSVVMLLLCLFWQKNHFHPFLLSVLKINDNVNFEDNFFVQF